MEKERTYIAIDLKSFYASVECVERGLDPLDTFLVVADASRTEKTICLAVSPPLKSFGLHGRPRLFEAEEKVREINAMRRQKAPGHEFAGTSGSAAELEKRPELALEYVVATPRMALYMAYSARIYRIYLQFVAPEDIHVYSIDEVFLDVTDYLMALGMTPREMAAKMIREVLQATGITATAGIGTNLYLCKIAMDIVAKHCPPDENGVRIAQLNEEEYRRRLWSHRPLTDFWRVGRGYAKKLEQYGLYTMGDIARCSLGKKSELKNEDLLYRLFGVNAELLIDHAWGWESCTMADIKSYRPQNNSFSSGQVLMCPYCAEKARLIVKEMADQMALSLVEKGLVTDQLALLLNYDGSAAFNGQTVHDRYGKTAPKPSHGAVSIKPTSSSKLLIEAATRLFDSIADGALKVRRITLSVNHVVPENTLPPPEVRQLDFFSDPETQETHLREESAAREREKRAQKAVLDIQKKYGKNAILRGMNLEEGATGMERNRQIGGHKA